jgi:ATP-dependent RNA helicase RhlE
MEFKDLLIIPQIQKALVNQQYTTPTPIQEKAIPPIMEGRDVLGCAQTGTGKTAAYALPILQHLYLQSQSGTPGLAQRRIRALILCPTRELALQIYESFCAYGQYTGLRYCAVFGGVSQKPQEIALKRGVDILIATPGRLDDLMNQGLINLGHVEILTLDEADMMLDMGFIQAVKKIIAKIPEVRQTLFFSATMPPEIVELSKTILSDPVKITITPEAPAVEAIDQRVYFVDKINKRQLLLHLLKDEAITSALVFTRTKHGADRVVRDLWKGQVNADAIHGNKSQNARQKALNDFKNKSTRVLVATDVAARGLDIDDVSHVFNYDLPEVPETYVHRIGRTGRIGKSGIAYSFCDIEEVKLLRDIEKLCGKIIRPIANHPYPMRIMHVPPKQAGNTREFFSQDVPRRPSMQSGTQHPHLGAKGTGYSSGRHGTRGNRPS